MVMKSLLKILSKLKKQSEQLFLSEKEKMQYQ